MFERFTERARQVVVLAQEEARTLKHNWIGTEHILLGLLREEEGLAASVLESLGVALERVRADVVAIVGCGEDVTADQIPFTPRAKKLLELALQEALILRHTHLGTEHILLGLVRENQGVASRVLLDLGADAQKIRETVLQSLPRPNNEKKREVRQPADALARAEAVRRARRAGVARSAAPTTPPSFAQALARALEQAAVAAGARPLDAGDLLLALLEQPDGLIASALAETDIDVGALHEAIEAARRRSE